uniref:Uncharacterized protein n=1 Tax=Oryza punctata TaxID=4537 RepID=A0A0E0LXJ0_ORYPU
MSQVLAHPTVRVLTHRDWNSTTEAISASVPMVAVPRWSDQAMNANVLMCARGSGSVDGVVERGKVEQCVREVMEREEYWRNTGKWREMA